MVSFEEFAKIELKVAKVLSCEPVVGSAKLFKLTLSVGEETRAIVSGIAGHYSPQQLVGKKIIIVANLEPKVIRGVESRGMLLAAEDSAGNLSIVTLDRPDIADGSTVR